VYVFLESLFSHFLNWRVILRWGYKTYKFDCLKSLKIKLTIRKSEKAKEKLWCDTVWLTV